MKKIALVYISLTGNTASMAEVVETALKDRAEVTVFDVSQDDFVNPSDFDAIAFGCPAMGQEVLEEDSFEPMFASVEKDLKGKRIALFGSYGWGDGEWMRSWQERCESDGAELTCEPVIAMEAGDDFTVTELKALAESLL